MGSALLSDSASAQSFVQATGNVSAGAANSLSLAFSANTTAGNLIVVALDFTSNAAFSSISDSQGNTYTQVGSQLTTPGGAVSRVYYAGNIKGGSDTITISLSGSANFLELYLTEYTGVAQATPLDGQAGASGNAGAVSSGNATTTVTGDLIVGYCVGDILCSAGSGFTPRSTFNGNLIEDIKAGSPGPYAATATSNSGWSMQMLALKAAVSSSSPLNSCDLAPPYGILDASDVQAAINMSLGVSPCTANIVGANICNVVVVQRVINAGLPSGTCTTGNTVSHSVSLTWAASTTSNVTYNVYRATSSGAYPPTPFSSAGSGTSFVDSSVQSGATYYYVITAVSNGVESVRSNEAAAVIPVP